jgi:hypothetical protein
VSNLKKNYFLPFIICILLTIIILNSSYSLLCGFPLYIYSIFPYGPVFMVILTFIYISSYIWLVWNSIFWRKNYKYLVWVGAIALFLSLNYIFSKQIKFEIDIIKFFIELFGK